MLQQTYVSIFTSETNHRGMGLKPPLSLPASVKENLAKMATEASKVSIYDISATVYELHMEKREWVL